ncbi:hypothetical protein LZ30DRAFT_402731 [Colletotrichum cereale]|nr:hypothetical protein LZ30DRAFT_402731 [Colletotrichum cereale]
MHDAGRVSPTPPPLSLSLPASRCHHHGHSWRACIRVPVCTLMVTRVCAVLCCVVLCCAVLCCVVLCCAVLCRVRRVEKRYGDARHGTAGQGVSEQPRDAWPLERPRRGRLRLLLHASPVGTATSVLAMRPYRTYSGISSTRTSRAFCHASSLSTALTERSCPGLAAWVSGIVHLGIPLSHPHAYPCSCIHTHTTPMSPPPPGETCFASQRGGCDEIFYD